MPIVLQNTSITGIGVGGLPDTVNAGRLLQVDTYTNDPGTNNASFSQMTNGGTFTWNKPVGCKYAYVICTGGGAGSACNDSSYRMFNGGAGATAIGWYDVTAVNSVTVVVGNGTNGTRAADGARPGTGGTSSFGSFCSATGGRGGGDRPWGGGRGGYATGGNVVNIPGGGGDGDHANTGAEFGGGDSFWHRTGGAHNNGTGQGDTNLDRMRVKGRYGSGGGGAYGSQIADNNWRAGGAGVVVVYSYS